MFASQRSLIKLDWNAVCMIKQVKKFLLWFSRQCGMVAPTIIITWKEQSVDNVDDSVAKREKINQNENLLRFHWEN